MFILGFFWFGVLCAQIEVVCVRDDYCDGGFGMMMLEWVIDEACWCGCALVQFIIDKLWLDVLCFYECLGFCATHEGFKFQLEVVLD